MALSALLVSSIILFFVIIISALPLYFAVKLLGGNASIVKILIVNIIVAIAIPIIKSLLGLYGGIIAFIFLLFVYKTIFNLGWFRAFLAWIMQFVIVVILVWVLLLFEVSVIAL